MFFSNKSFLSQRDFETRTISCFTSFETGLDEKKHQEKVIVMIFVHPFIPKSGEAEISPKQKKTIPWIFLLEMVRLSVGELRDSFGRALGTSMALPKKGR